MTSDETAVLCKIAFANWPSYQVTPELVISWGMTLADCEFNDAKTAISELIREPERQFPPKPGEVLAEVNRTKKALPPPHYEGELLENYDREVNIAGKKEIRNYVRATAGYREEYKRHAKEQGRTYRDVPQTMGIYRDSDGNCSLDPKEMKKLFNMLYDLMDSYTGANDEEALAKCDERRDALKELYFDIIKDR